MPPRSFRHLPVVSTAAGLTIEQRRALLGRSARPSSSIADGAVVPAAASSVVPAGVSGLAANSAISRTDAVSSQLHAGRVDTPAQNITVRGRAQDALQGLADFGLDQLVESLERDRHATSAAAPQASLLRTWERFHRAVLGDRTPTYPLALKSLIAISAIFKRGGYRAFQNYVSAAKARHKELGHQWSDQLDNAVRWCTRSVVRGIGPPRQSQPLWFHNLLRLELDFQPLVQDGPIGPWHLAMLATMFLLREIEVAHALRSSLTYNCTMQEVTLLLPVSKSDPSALGTSRTWCCLCQHRALACPYHVALAYTQHWDNKFGRRAAASSMYLFPTSTGEMIQKVAVISSFEALARLVGQPTQADNGSRLLGGHSARVTGAQILAAHGIEVNRIRILARHSGDTILRYVGDAPLAALRMEMGQPASSPRSALVTDAGRRVRARIDTLEAAIDRLETRIPSLPSAPASSAPAALAPARFVENLTTLVAHQLRANCNRTICGWNLDRQGAYSAQHCTIDSLDDRPFWLICERCCPTERQIAKGTGEDSDDQLSD